MDPRSRPTRPWGQATVTTLRTALTGIAAIQVVVAAGLIAASVDLSLWQSLVGAALIALQQIYQVGALWRPQPAFRVTIVVLSLLAAGSWLLLLYPSEPGILARRWFPSPLFVGTLGILAFVRPRRRWSMIVAVLLINAGLRILTWPDGVNTPEGLTLVQSLAVESGRLAALGVTAVLTCALAISAARRLDQAADLGRLQQHAAVLARARSSRARAVDRFVHDEILHGLRTVAMDRSVVPAVAAQRAAATLRSLLLRPPHTEPAQVSGTSLVNRLRVVADGVGLHVTVTGPESLEVPSEVAQAFESAVREALRNVQQHAGITSAEVLVNQNQLQVTVTVIDRGRGFTPSDSSQRHGVSGSIAARMADVDGDATVASTPGQGTTVRLRWSPLPVEERRPGTLAHGAVVGLLPTIAMVIMPIALTAPWMAAWLCWGLKWPLALLALSVAQPVVQYAAVRRGLSRGQLSAVESWALAGFATLSCLIGGLALPQGPGGFNLYWLALSASLGISVLSLFRPLRESLILGFVLTGVVWATTARLSDGWFNSDYAPAFGTTILMSVVAWIVARTLARMSFDILSAEEASAQASASAVAATEFEHELRDRLRPHQDQLMAFLDQVARDPQAVTLVGVRREAAELERTTRESMLSSRTPLLSEVARLRENGWTVTLRATSGLPVAVEQRAVDALTELAERFPSPCVITLTAAELGDRWRLSILLTAAEGPGESTAEAGAWLGHWVDYLHAHGWRTTVAPQEVHAVASVAAVPEKHDSPAAP